MERSCDLKTTDDSWGTFLHLFDGWPEENKLEFSDSYKIMYEYPKYISTETIMKMIEYAKEKENEKI